MKAYKTELDPNATQRQALLRNAGAARWVYNWALARKQEEYKAGNVLRPPCLHATLLDRQARRRPCIDETRNNKRSTTENTVGPALHPVNVRTVRAWRRKVAHRARRAAVGCESRTDYAGKSTDRLGVVSNAAKNLFRRKGCALNAGNARGRVGIFYAGRHWMLMAESAHVAAKMNNFSLPSTMSMKMAPGNEGNLGVVGSIGGCETTTIHLASRRFATTATAANMSMGGLARIVSLSDLNPVSSLAVSPTVTACGGSGAGAELIPRETAPNEAGTSCIGRNHAEMVFSAREEDGPPLNRFRLGAR